jgi:hypothetical protein
MSVPSRLLGVVSSTAAMGEEANGDVAAMTEEMGTMMARVERVEMRRPLKDFILVLEYYIQLVVNRLEIVTENAGDKLQKCGEES